MLANVIFPELTPDQKVEALESHMLGLPQVDCPVVHHFGPGIYIREVRVPKGALSLGHVQKKEHLNIMLQGAVAMPSESGGLKILRAPLIFTGQPGRKFGYVLEDMVWQNVYATDETDIDRLEEMFLDKSEPWQEQDSLLRQIQESSHQPDREDFDSLLSEINLTAEEVRAQSENDEDQIPMPDGFINFTVRDSYIEGKGAFLSVGVEENTVIAPARVGGRRTPAGRFVNHAKSANAAFVMSDNGDIYLVATRPISGCVGGEQGEEITVNYRQALSLSSIQIGEHK